MEGRAVGAWIEVTLSRARWQRRRLGADRYTPTEVMVLKRFRRSDLAGYSSYAGHLEDAARIAPRGELGYSVHTAAEDGVLTASLAARLLAQDGRVHTEISNEHHFENPDSEIALVQTNEKAAELRAAAAELNDE